jgi:DNA end-binding protein Ku
MPRAVWTGALSFGLVNIPVALYRATEPKDVQFHLFDRSGRRIRYRRVVETGEADPIPEAESPVEAIRPSQPEDVSPGGVADIRTPSRGPRQVEVPYEDVVRGYELDRDHFVFVEQEEIERIRPTRSRTIELEDFVRLEDIDPVYFEKSYYLAPRYGAQAEKPYLLLLKAMESRGQVGIGRFVLRTKPHLVAIRPIDGALGLETLYFSDEVRSAYQVTSLLEGAVVSDRELKLAEQLIQTLETEWTPAAYADEYREELLRLIAEKTPEEVEVESAAPGGSRIEDLMDALKRSVDEARREANSDKRPERRTG